MKLDLQPLDTKPLIQDKGLDLHPLQLTPISERKPTKTIMGTSATMGQPELTVPMGDLANIQTLGTRLLKGYGRGVSGMVTGVGGALKWLGAETVGKPIAEYGQKAEKFYEVKDPKFIDQLASGIGSMSTFYIPGMGIAKGAQALMFAPRLALWFGVSASSIMEAITEAGGNYEQTLSRGKPTEEARTTANKTFWANLPLLVITNKLGLFADKGVAVKKALMSSLMEGSQEGTQEIIGNIALHDPVLQGVPTSIGVGALTGGGMSIIQSGAETIDDRTALKLEKQKLDELRKKETIQEIADKIDAEAPQPLQLEEIKPEPTITPEPVKPQPVAEVTQPHKIIAKELQPDGTTIPIIKMEPAKPVETVPTIPTGTQETANTIKLYRGEGYGKAGSYYTENEEFAQEFAGIKPLKEIIIPKNLIYRPEILPEATTDISTAITEAKNKGFKAVFVDEGKPFGEPIESVFIFDKSIIPIGTPETAEITAIAPVEAVSKGEAPLSPEKPIKHADKLSTAELHQFEEVKKTFTDIDERVDGTSKDAHGNVIVWFTEKKTGSTVGLELKDATKENILKEIEKKQQAKQKGLYAKTTIEPVKVPEIAKELIKRQETIPLKLTDKITVKDVSGQSKTITPEPDMFISKVGKNYEIHDGQTVLVRPNVAQDIQNKYKIPVYEKGEFAPELKQIKGIVKRGKESKYEKLIISGGREYREILLQDIQSKAIGESAKAEYEAIERPAKAEYEAIQKSAWDKYAAIERPAWAKYEAIGESAWDKAVVNKIDYEAIQKPAKAEYKAITTPAWDKYIAIQKPAWAKYKAIRSFISPHFKEESILSHLRLDERTTLKGEKVLFIEEIQSDWASALRKGTAPDHPLLKNWQELTLKRALQEAANTGAKYLSWTTGEQQADRYNLAKQIDSIQWGKTDKGYWIQPIKENRAIPNLTKSEISQEKLSDYIGKGASEKIIKQSVLGHTEGELTNENLKIGGEWAKNLYDKQIPNILKDLTGQDVETIQLEKTKQQAIEITPEIVNKVKGIKPKIGKPKSIFQTPTLKLDEITPENISRKLKEIQQRYEKPYEIIKPKEVKTRPTVKISSLEEQGKPVTSFIGKRGGIRPPANKIEMTEYTNNVDFRLRNKTGLPPDEMASEVGRELFGDEMMTSTELYKKIQSEKTGGEELPPYEKATGTDLEVGDKFTRQGIENTVLKKTSEYILFKDIEGKETKIANDEVIEFDTGSMDMAQQKKIKPFLIISKDQTVTNTLGNEIKLKANEPYRVIDLGKGKILLQDGKKVKIFEGELKNIEGIFSNEPNIAAGGIARVPSNLEESKMQIIESTKKKVKDSNMSFNLYDTIKKDFLGDVSEGNANKNNLLKLRKYIESAVESRKSTETGVGKYGIMNNKNNINGKEKSRIMRKLLVSLLGNKAEVISRFSEQFKQEIKKGVTHVMDLFGGAKAYRKGLFFNIPAENYQLNELSDERYNLFKNTQDPEKIKIIENKIKELSDNLFKRVSDELNVQMKPEDQSGDMIDIFNKWLIASKEGKPETRTLFVVKIIQKYGNKLLEEAVADKFKSPESSAKYYFLMNTGVYGIKADKGQYYWGQGIVKQSEGMKTVKDLAWKIKNVSNILKENYEEDKNIPITQEDAWTKMQNITKDIKTGKIDPNTTVITVDPQYLNPSIDTYSEGGTDSKWAGYTDETGKYIPGHKDNLEKYLLPLKDTGVRIIYTNNVDSNLTDWLKEKGIKYDVEQSVGKDRDEIISFINYQFSEKFTSGEPRVTETTEEFKPSPNFQTFLKELEQKGVSVGQLTTENQFLINRIKNTQNQKALSGQTVSRIKQYFGIEKLKKSGIEPLKKLADYLDTLEDGDSLLSDMQLKSLKGIIGNTPDIGILPKRIVIDKFGDKQEILSRGIIGKIADEILPTVDIEEGHPLIKRIIDKTRMLFSAKDKIMSARDERFDKMITLAEKSRASKLSLKERAKRYLVPANKELFKALSGEQIELTPDERAVFAYAKNFFAKVKNDPDIALQRTRQKYVTHLDQTFMEKIIDKGLIGAVADIMRPESVTIPTNIFIELDNIIGSTKFFKFALERKGGLTPTTNLRRILHEYQQLYETKKALDQVLPEGQAIAQLLVKPRTAMWLKEFFQNLKGRGLDYNFKRGKMGWLTKTADFVISVGYLKLLGLNWQSGVKNLIAGEGNTFIWNGVKPLLLGKKRYASNPKKAHKLMQEYNILDGTYTEFAERGLGKAKKIADVLMILQQGGEYVIRGVDLFIGQLTEQEWNTGKISNERLLEMKNDIAITQGIFNKIESPLWIQTTFGRLVFQMNRWRITNAMLIRRILNDAIPKWQKKDFKNKETERFAKMILLYGIALYANWELGKAGYKKAQKIAMSLGETLNNTIELITTPVMLKMFADNPTFSILKELYFSIQRLANYVAPAIAPEPQKLEFRKGIEKTYVAPYEKLKEIFGEPKTKTTPGLEIEVIEEELELEEIIE